MTEKDCLNRYNIGVPKRKLRCNLQLIYGMVYWSYYSLLPRSAQDQAFLSWLYTQVPHSGCFIISTLIIVPINFWLNFDLFKLWISFLYRWELIPFWILIVKISYWIHRLFSHNFLCVSWFSASKISYFIFDARYVSPDSSEQFCQA